MAMLNKLRLRLRALFFKPKMEEELDEEVKFHLEKEIEQNLTRGMSPEEARLAALRSFGGVERVKEESRDVRGVRLLEEVWQDLRYGARMLWKKPGFTAIVVLSMALGISANATIFSFVNELLLRPPSVERPGQLLEVWNHYRQGGSSFTSFEPLSYPEYESYRDHNQVFSEMLAFDGDPAFISWSRQGQGEMVQGQYVSGNFFSCLEVKAAVGRMFLPEEDRTPGAHPVVVLSHAFWRQRLGADPNVIGSTLILNGTSFSVIGIAPADFAGLIVGVMPDVWVPMMMGPQTRHEPELLTRRDSHWILGIGRLKPDITSTQAEADLNVLARQLEQAYPKTNAGYGAVVFPAMLLPGPARGVVGAFSGLLMLVVGLVLLIACANAASFLLARATSRRRETAIRAALGASRWQLIRQTLTESVLLACLSGALGLLLTQWTAPMVLALKPPTLPLRFAVSIDYRVFGFTLLVSLLAGLLFGLAPAWRGTRVDLTASLKDGTSGEGYRKSRLRGLLVIGQVAICSLLLVGSGLCLRSLLNAQSIDPGFDPGNRVIARLDLLSLGYSESRGKDFFKRLIERVNTIPGVQSASLTSHLPLGVTTTTLTFNIEGRQPPPGAGGFGAGVMRVGPDYFKTLGTTLLRGREFTSHDAEGAPLVTIINEEMARRFWPDRDPVGASLTIGGEKNSRRYEIVGVVKTGKYRTLGERLQPFLYQSILQHYDATATLVARTSGDPGSLLAATRHEIGALDPNLAPIELGTLREHLAFALFPARLIGALLGVFGLLALALALIGLSGLIAYSVSQRTREIGIRVALGARARDVLKMVIGEGLILTMIGMAVGLIAAVVLTRCLSDMLYGVSATDPWTFTAIVALLTLVALLACYVPARRATKVDPLVALRCD
jgi:predicted permease